MPTIKPKSAPAKAQTAPAPAAPAAGIVPVQTPIHAVPDQAAAPATTSTHTANESTKKERGPSLTWNGPRLKALIRAIRFGRDTGKGEAEQHTPKSLIVVLKTLPEFAGVGDLITPEKLRLVTKWLRDVAGPANNKDFSDIVLAHEAGGFVSRKRDLDWNDLANTGLEAE